MTLLQKLASVLIVITFTAPVVAAEKLDVVASFSILGDFAKKIGGDRIELRTIVGPNSDAHVYEPKPADAMAVAKADVVLVNGLQFEGFLRRLIEASGTSAGIVEVSKGAEILEDPAGGHHHHDDGEAAHHESPLDPHAWQSVANAKIYVKNIEAAFCKADAEGCAVYRENAKAYGADLDALDRQIRDTIAAIPQDRRIFVVAHHAFRYFERDYGVTFIAAQGVATDSEASAADVAGVLREIAGKRAVAIFAENIANTRLIEQIAAEAGLKLGGALYSDALSAPGGAAATYIDMMRRNLATIRAAAAP